MDDNEKVVALAKSRGLDVELWPTGAGVENVALVISRDASGRPWRVWIGADCTFAEGFTFSREDWFDGFWDAYIWDDEGDAPSTDDPVAVVDYIEAVRDTFVWTGTYPDCWRIDEDIHMDPVQDAAGLKTVTYQVTVTSPSQAIIDEIVFDLTAAMENWDDRKSDEWLTMTDPPSDEDIEATIVKVQEVI